LKSSNGRDRELTVTKRYEVAETKQLNKAGFLNRTIYIMFCRDRSFLVLIVTMAILLLVARAYASPSDVPAPPKPEHQRKSHTKLSGELKFCRSDWERLKFNQAKVGDYVEYQINDGKRSCRRKVEEIGDHLLVVEETQTGSRKAPVSHIHYSFELADEITGPGNSIRESSDRIEVLGQLMPTRLREVVYKNKALEQSWYADDVPLGGLVKHVGGDGKVKQVLTAYGRGQ
jgi:hypothetical protein